LGDDDEYLPTLVHVPQVHGLLEPLVNIDLSPEVNILVKIYHGQEERQERISVRQTVKQFKLFLQVSPPLSLQLFLQVSRVFFIFSKHSEIPSPIFYSKPM